jgi:hypothetical protein
MRGLKQVLFALAILAAMSSSAYAQATLSGVVKDASGAVLPGVTVEAASDVLIEKVRSAQTDGTGRYQILDLRPGTYTVTFTLTGFATIKRENIPLTGFAVTTADAEMRVGAVSETVTVTGETPVVDVQTATRQTIIGQDVVAALPTSRNSFSLGAMITGVNVRDGFGAVTDVGGATGPSTLALSAHGGKTEDQRLLMNGVALSTMIGGGWGGGAIPNASGTSEFAIDTAAVDATAATGGVRINFIPRDGGNRVSGTIAGSFANDSMQPDSFVQGLPFITNPDGFRASTVKSNGEFNPGVGGPFKKDSLWFFFSGRYQVANSYVPNIFHDKNVNNPATVVYDPDFTKPGVLVRDWHVYQGRLTWQASQKNKIGFTYDQENFCICSNGITATVAPEASNEFNFPLQRYIQVDWNMPASSKLLIEASGIHRVERWGGMERRHGADDLPDVNPLVISMSDPQNLLGKGPITWRAPHSSPFGPPYNNSWNVNLHYRAAVSYITGSHAFKAGFNNAWGHHENTAFEIGPYSYDITLGPTPTSGTLNLMATPYTTQIDVDADFGAFVQDKWTHDRLTATGALRFDWFKNSYPEQTVGLGILAPARNITFPQTDNISWKDITPRVGLVYDVFGNGKTALKTSLNKYLVGLGTFSFGANNGITSARNPVNTLVNTASRPWTDSNGNYVADCPAGLGGNAPPSGECGAISNPNFGIGTVPPLTTYDPEILSGWNNRNYNWEFSLGVQHEVAPRVSVDVSYFRRWYGNFFVQYNRAYTPAQFSKVDVVAPSNPGLPDGGGYTVSGVIVGPPGFGVVDDNFVTLSDNLPGNPKLQEHWNGIDVSVNARPQGGVLLQGGMSVGRTSVNYCDVINSRPEAAIGGAGLAAPLPGFLRGIVPFFTATPSSFCDISVTPVSNGSTATPTFIAQFKGSALYTIPHVDVSLAGTFQSVPGPVIAAQYNAPNGVGFVNVVRPGDLYGDRLNQFDFRVGKLFRHGRTRTNVALDIYNLLNSHPVLTENSVYTTWRQPTTMLQARFFKISAQFDF